MLSFTEAIYMSKMLEFLESKFGFWLITTVLVAAATTANAFLQNYFVERQKKAGLRIFRWTENMETAVPTDHPSDFLVYDADLLSWPVAF